MNADKLKKLQAEVRIGGKGTPRRKKKIVHATPTDDKKLQSSLKKISVETIPGIEEINMIKNDGTVIHFTNPKTQASLSNNTIAITGRGETMPLADMLPGLLNQLNCNVPRLKKIASQLDKKRRCRKTAGRVCGGGAACESDDDDEEDGDEDDKKDDDGEEDDFDVSDMTDFDAVATAGDTAAQLKAQTFETTGSQTI